MYSPTCPVCGGEDCISASSAFGHSLHNGEQFFCKTCGHGFRPVPVDYAYASSAMCGVDASRKRLSGQVSWFAPYLPEHPRILEVGCAGGGLAAMTRQMLSPARYDAIELSKTTGAQAAQHLDTLYDQPLRTLIFSGALTGPYDMVVVSHVLEHMGDPQAEMLAMKSLLAPDGALFIEVPHGSGHRKFPADDNPAHIHFFSPDSLMRLVMKAGLHTRAISTDVYMDARYAASIRIVAAMSGLPAWRGRFLSEYPGLKNAENIVVWGAPSLVEDVLANFFDMSKIDFFIDCQSEKQGTPRLGKDVRGPDALGTTPRTVFINSIYWEDDIRKMIATMYPGVPHRIFCMRELLDG